MNLVDSSGWLEYFDDGKNSKIFAPVIENLNELIVSPINIYEIYKKMLSKRGENDALEAVGFMYQAKVVDVNFSISVQAAKLSSELKLPMADSLIYASAIQNDAIVWTQDYDFKGLD